ncbi:MAG: endonuclease V [Candidatus Kapabacteria bacterium]|nr:endonuclease V [Candidatus Kapabacteria bacterium]
MLENLINTTLELEAQQRNLAKSVIVKTREESPAFAENDCVFTLDVQYVGEVGFVALDVMRFSGKKYGIFVSKQHVTFPYIPQFFSFREAPLLLHLIRRVILQTGLQPTLLIIDGHGTAHPRKFGIASHIGVEMNLPTIGAAKEPLLRYSGALGEKRGSTLPMLLDGETVGYVLRTQDGTNPVFVSVGHLLNAEAVCEIVIKFTTNYRISEPLRRADQAARAFARGEREIALATGNILLHIVD